MRRLVAGSEHDHDVEILDKNIYIGTFTAIEPAYIAYRLTKSSLCGGGFQMPDVDLAHQQRRRA